MLFQRSFNLNKSYMEVNRASHKYGFVNRSLSFILMIIFQNIFTTELLINYLSSFLTVVTMVTHTEV